ncbi:hypothetical protein FRB93_008029, partial [Tulasnella sp. JGI-2019a]
MDNVPAELQNFWTTVERKCAGTLFLQVWNAVMDADGAGPPTPKLLNWTSPETIEAFASWLTDYDGQEMVEIKLDGVVLMQTPARLDLGARFVDHATLANNQSTQEFGLQDTFEKALHADHDLRGHVPDRAQDTDLQKAARDVTVN